MSGLIDALRPYLTRELPRSVGTALFYRGDTVEHLYVIRGGCVHLQRNSPTGAAAVMQRAMEGSVLAESSIFSPIYHCDAMVVADALVERASIARIRNALREDASLLAQLTIHLAREVQRTRSRVEILARHTVQERLDCWLALNDGKLPPRGTWRAVADDIGVSPEAFYRELQRRRLAES